MGYSVDDNNNCNSKHNSDGEVSSIIYCSVASIWAYNLLEVNGETIYSVVRYCKLLVVKRNEMMNAKEFIPKTDRTQKWRKLFTNKHSLLLNHSMMLTTLSD